MTLGIMQPYFMPYIGYWQFCYRQHQEQAIGCSLKFPIVSGWDDARVIHRQDVDYSSFNLKMRMQKRLDFVKQRYLFEHTPITFAHLSAWKIYRYCYGKIGFIFSNLISTNRLDIHLN